MTRRIVTAADAIDRKEWERFVCDHLQGNVFQTPQMFAAYGATKNYQPIVMACYEEDSLVGILLAVVQKEYKGLLGKLSARSIIWGGPLVRDNDIGILQDLMNEYNRIVKYKAIYTQIRNIYIMDWAKNDFKKLGYDFEEHLNIFIDLNKSEDELWKEVHSKRKNEIRRASKEGTSFTEFSDCDALKKSWPILKDVYQRAKLPLPDISLFQNILVSEGVSAPLKIFAALNNGQWIGVLLALCWRERVINWYAGAFQKDLSKYPNDLLPWEVILWAKRNGYKLFDFGGAGKPGIPYGVRDFKLKFGGELVNFGRFQKTHKPITMNVAKLGFRLWQLLKK